MVQKSIRGLLLAGTTFCAMAGASFADTVKIQTVDGNVSLEGRIVSFDGETFELDTLAGTKIPLSMVICIGDACPVIEDTQGLSGLAQVVDAPSTILLNNLARDFAGLRGWRVQNSPATDSDGGVFEFAGSASEDAGTLSIEKGDAAPVFEALAKGDTSFVLSATPISDALADKLVAQGYPDLRAPGREVIVALDAIVPQVHADNPVRDISLPVIARIAAGRIDNWSELGGPDQPIRLILPTEASSVARLVEDRVMRPNRLRVERDLERVADEAEAVAETAADPFAITLASGVLVDGTKPLPIRQVCGPLSFATDFSVKAEEYPLARRVLLYTNGQELSQSMKELLAFAGSQSAQDSIRGVGFVGQNVEGLCQINDVI